MKRRRTLLGGALLAVAVVLLAAALHLPIPLIHDNLVGEGDPLGAYVAAAVIGTAGVAVIISGRHLKDRENLP